MKKAWNPTTDSPAPKDGPDRCSRSGKLGAGQERYYLEKVAEGAEDYYSGEGEAEGYWLGQAAEEPRRFSTRRAEILAAVGEGASAREMQIATLTSRQAKDRDITTESLRETWRAKGEEVGLIPKVIAGRLGYERPLIRESRGAEAIERYTREGRVVPPSSEA